MTADLQTVVGDATRRLLEAEGWNSESHRHRQARLACGFGARNLRQPTLIGYLPEGEQAVDRAGVSGHPTAKGSRSRGCNGALRFHPSGVGGTPHSSREAPSGLRHAPAGLRGANGAGERESAAAGAWRRRAATPRSLLARCSARPADLWPTNSMSFRLCSDGGRPGGQGSGERRECNRH
jgi:hypothetical protein